MIRTLFQNRRSPGSILLLFACTLLFLLGGGIHAAGQRAVLASTQDPSVQDTCSDGFAWRPASPLSSTMSYLPLLQNCTAPAATPTATPDPWTAPAAAIEVFSPITDSVYHSPIEVIGYSQTFEGSVVVRLRNATGEVIAERPTQGGSVDGYDFFHTRLRFYTDEQQDGTVEVFEISAEDGSEIHKVTIPILMLPGQRVLDLDAPEAGQAACSPVVVSGYSNTFEANVVAELHTRSGTLITMTTTMGGNLGFFRNFSAILPHDVATPQPVLAGVYGGEGQGLGPLDHTRMPVSLYPCP